MCARRLINALLTTVASWLLCLVFARREFLEIGLNGWITVAVVVTMAMAAFSAWAFVFGDRRAWARAVNRESPSDGGPASE